MSLNELAEAVLNVRAHPSLRLEAAVKLALLVKEAPIHATGWVTSASFVDHQEGSSSPVDKVLYIEMSTVTLRFAEDPVGLTGLMNCRHELLIVRKR
jgi:hypothetical protein